MLTLLFSCKSLFIDHNEITAIPTEIGALKNLRVLKLGKWSWWWKMEFEVFCYFCDVVLTLLFSYKSKDGNILTSDDVPEEVKELCNSIYCSFDSDLWVDSDTYPTSSPTNTFRPALTLAPTNTFRPTLALAPTNKLRVICPGQLEADYCDCGYDCTSGSDYCACSEAKEESCCNNR